MLRFESSSSGVTALKYGTKSGFLNTSCSTRSHAHCPVSISCRAYASLQQSREGGSGVFGEHEA